MIKNGQRSVSINVGTVAHVAATMTTRFSRRLFRLPFALAICHMKRAVNLHEEHEKQISRIYRQISFCWQLLQLKMKDKGE